MLRDYQIEAVANVNNAYAQGFNYVLLVMPTGSGKTVVFSDMCSKHTGAGAAIAHRQELVLQISNSFANYKIPHKIIGPDNLIKFVTRQHILNFGTSYYNPNAAMAVISVDTLLRRYKDLKSWCESVTFWVQDEAHHILKKNKWGRAAELFPNARGLGVTATPIRADGKGLNAETDGIFETLILGPHGRLLIDRGYLTDYRIFCPQTKDLDLDSVPLSPSTGDFVKEKLKRTVRKSKIVGDVVQSYKSFADGKLGVTFVTDTKTGTDIVNEYRNAGIPAELVTYQTNDSLRQEIIEKFRRRELLQLVNIDLFGEGFDLPAIEVVSFARPTNSYSLFAQQFGRALRILDGKEVAIIIDHVGNVLRHQGTGLPDSRINWSLEGREKRASTASEIKLKICPSCTQPRRAYLKECPYCGFYAPPAERSAPEFVEGDLIELDRDVLEQMRTDSERATMSDDEKAIELIKKRCPSKFINSNLKKHGEYREAQIELRESIAQWAGYQNAYGLNDSEVYRLFYLRFGVDILSAQAIDKKQTVELNGRVIDDFGHMG